MFNDRGASVEAAPRVIRGDRYETEDQEKTRYDRFAGVVLAFGGLLV
jgi:ribosomal protein L19